jgi:hypothetical protein
MSIFKEREKLKDTTKGGEIVGLDEALAKISLELMNPEEEKLLTVSDVTPEEIFGLSTLLCYAKIFRSTLIEGWIKNFLLLRISRMRIGRKEFLILGSGLGVVSDAKGKSKSVKDLFAGL